MVLGVHCSLTHPHQCTQTKNVGRYLSVYSVWTADTPSSRTYLISLTEELESMRGGLVLVFWPSASTCRACPLSFPPSPCGPSLLELWSEQRENYRCHGHMKKHICNVTEHLWFIFHAALEQYIPHTSQRFSSARWYFMFHTAASQTKAIF